MEELLSKLIEKGWKPRGEKVYKTKKRTRNLIRYNKMSGEIYFYVLYDGLDNQFQLQRTYILRQLVSKESGLWQFVCENRLWKDIDEEKYWHKKTPKMSELRTYDYHFEEYRLIESALKDESELESFILDNIVIKDG